MMMGEGKSDPETNHDPIIFVVQRIFSFFFFSSINCQKKGVCVVSGVDEVEIGFLG